MSEHSYPSEHTVPVWDILIRIFHWSLVVFFSVSYVTGELGDWLHHWSGYTITGLLVFRLVWGVIGTEHARFRDFVRHPAHIRRYLTAMKEGRAERYLGHNPAGGVMIIALLLGLSFMAFSGMLLAGFDGDGPLAGTALMALQVLPIKALHELTANALILGILLHVGGVIYSSWLHRENLPKAMVTGRKVSQEFHHE